MLALLLAAMLATPSGITVAGPGPGIAEVERALPAAVAQVERALGPVDWSPTRIAVVAGGADRARGAVAEWAAGYAYPASGRIVLRMDRIGGYPYASLNEVLVHELSHVAVARILGSRQIPRWFDEGLAMSTAHETGFRDSFRLSSTLIFGPRFSLDRLDDRFHSGRAEAQAAYGLASSFLSWLGDEHGPGTATAILTRTSGGLPFPEAVLAVTGQTTAELEAQWKHEVTLYYRWLPIATSTVTLWIGISLLAILAFRRRRQRMREELERWALQEGELTEVDTSGRYGPN